MKSKNLNGEALGALLAMCRDVASADPVAASNLEDEFRSASCGSEGSKYTVEDFHIFAVVQLPKIGKWFDKLLSTEPSSLKQWPPLVLDGSEVDLESGVIPVLDSLFWESGNFVSTATTSEWVLDPTKVLMARQLLLHRKRFIATCPEEVVVDAVREFWDIEAQMRTSRSIDTDLMFEPRSGPFSESLKPGDLPVLKRLVVCLDKVSRRLAPNGLLKVEELIPGHGPGAVSDLPYEEKDKYTFPSYPAVVQESFPESYFCSVNYRTWVYDVAAGLRSGRVNRKYKPAANLIAVAKTIEKPRLIASEPVVGQYLQQALLKWLRANLHPIHSVMVAFRDQEPSREAARKASEDGESATIDLSSASDRMSLWAVESLFHGRQDLLRLLLTLRSNCVYDKHVLKGTQEIRKFAPQGNATTFPVQTLLYANVALAAYLVQRNLDKRFWSLSTQRLKRDARKIRIFGDDMIVPGDVVPLMSLLLDHLGLRINSKKTHVSGFFRESCGMDAYRGFDVTPAYISHEAPRSEKGLSAWVEISNNCHVRGHWHLAAWMADQVPAKIAVLVPISSESLGVTALKTFSRGTCSHIRMRYSKSLYRWEVKGLTQSVNAEVNKRKGHLDLLQYFLEEPSILTRWEAGQEVVCKPYVKVAWVDARVERPEAQ